MGVLIVVCKDPIPKAQGLWHLRELTKIGLSSKQKNQQKNSGLFQDTRSETLRLL